MSWGTTALSLALVDVSLRHLRPFGTVMLATHVLTAVQTVSQHSDSGMLITRDTVNAHSRKDAYIYTPYSLKHTITPVVSFLSHACPFVWLL